MKRNDLNLFRSLSLIGLGGFFALGCTSQAERAVAWIGDEVITARELELTLSAQQFPSPEAEHQAKLEFLEQLIEQRLGALEARRRGLDTTRECRIDFQLAERRIASGMLYQKEVVERIRVSDKELKDAYKLLGQEVHIKFIAVDTHEAAATIAEELRRGVPFETLAFHRSSHLPSRAQGGDLGFMPLLGAEEGLKDVLLSLRPSEISRPIKTSQGFIIVKLIESRKRPVGDFEEEKSKLKRILEGKKRQELDREFRLKYIEPAQLIYNPDGVALLVQAPLDSLTPAEGEIWVARYDDKTIQAKGLKEWLKRIPIPDPKDRELLIKNLMEMEVLYEVARKSGLLNGEDFQILFGQAQASILFNHLYEVQALSQVGVAEEEIREYYRSHLDDYYTEPPTRWLGLILVADSATAREVYYRLKQGERFEDLARRYSIHPSREQGGDLGFVNRYNAWTYEYARVGFDYLKEGEVSLPFQTRDGIAFVRCLGSRPERVRPLSEVRDEIVQTLKQEKARVRMKEFLESLKAHTPVKIAEEFRDRF